MPDSFTSPLVSGFDPSTYSLPDALRSPAMALERMAVDDAARMRLVLDARDFALRELGSSGLTAASYVANALAQVGGEPGDDAFEQFAKALTPVLGVDPSSPAEMGRLVVGQVLQSVASTDVVALLDGFPPVVEQVKGLAEVFDAVLGSDMERPFVQAATAWALPRVRSVHANADAGALALAVDLGLAAVKGTYQVGTGQAALDMVVEHLVDRASSGLVAGVRVAAGQIGADIGVAVGGFVASFVGMAPVGAALGAAIGHAAGVRVVDAIRSAAVKVATPLLKAAVTLAGTAIKTVGRVVSSVVGKFTSRLFG